MDTKNKACLLHRLCYYLLPSPDKELRDEIEQE